VVAVQVARTQGATVSYCRARPDEQRTDRILRRNAVYCLSSRDQKSEARLMAARPALRLIEGDRDRRRHALPEAVKFARSHARRDIDAMMACAK
jgi:hypothetical protein